ncbi:MAG: phosphate ABC transporter permease PstA [Myxococcota bacterium]|nr:phosphate ABC transporter permease PstA [Myxococcota bacterium]
MDERWRRRRIVNVLVQGACVLAVGAAVLPLAALLVFVGREGLAGLDWSFFTELPRPVGEAGGGMANAIVGTIEMVAIAAAIGVPPGVMAGIYLSEFGGGGFARVVRFSADVLAGVPSIVVGIFVYAMLVLWMGRFSAIAGGVALSILMLPTVTVTTQELLRMVPDGLREAALALGIPRWRATLRVVLRTAVPGIATGVMLAVARVAGETAPLLFTALNNRFWSQGIDQPTASLTVQIYTYAVSPFEDWHRQAWAAAVVLVGMVLTVNIAARIVLRHRVE